MNCREYEELKRKETEKSNWNCNDRTGDRQSELREWVEERQAWWRQILWTTTPPHV